VLRKRPASDVRRLVAVGTGVGIQIHDGELRIAVVKVRLSKVSLVAETAVPGFRHRPAAEWGAEVGGFLKKFGVAHIAATVLLPRTEIIVRQVFLPGVRDNDVGPAIQLQLDSLHPFADDEVYATWTRIGKTPYVLVGISRRATIDGYSTIFAEAGLKVASFTFSAAVMYSAARLITVPADSFVAAHVNDGVVEIYGESPARAIYSAALPMEVERAIGVARAELRLEPEAPTVRLADVLPKPDLVPSNDDPNTTGFEDQALPYATALVGACPWLAIEGNLLPADRRRSSSRVRLIPTVTLAVVLTILLAALALFSSWADARYLAVLQHEIAKYEPHAKRAAAIDAAISTALQRTHALDEFRRRPKLDMDALAEITKLIPPPGWVATLDMDRNLVQIGGETEQAATLLSTLDKSAHFDRSEFTMPISRNQTAEVFRIRTQRTVPPPANEDRAKAPAAPETKPEGAPK
jgi:Tfp pilus assembly protein PilN